MIRQRKLLAIFLACLLVITFVRCKKSGSSDPSPEQGVLTKLTKTWTCTSAIRDDVSQTGYGDFKLILSGTFGSTYQYSCSGRPALSAWPVSGTWSFGPDLQSSLFRDKGTANELPMTYVLTGDNQLTITFIYPDGKAGYTGRQDIVKGQWQFVFHN